MAQELSVGNELLHDNVLEKELLGIMLTDASTIPDIISICKPNHFYSRENSIIYSAICDVDSKGYDVDEISVYTELMDSGKISECGGLNYLNSLTTDFRNPANSSIYSRKLVELYQLREIYKKVHSVVKEMNTPGVDLSDVVQKCSDIVTMADTNDDVQSMYDAFGSLVKSVDQRKKDRANGRESVIRTGIKSLDRMIDGFSPCDLIIIGARPGAGKTALGLHFAKYAATNNVPVVYFTAEMTNEQMAERYFYGCNSSVSSQDLRYGNDVPGMNDAFLMHLKSIKDLPLYVCDNTDIDMYGIRARCKTLARKGKCSMVVIDYLQLIVGDGEKNKTRNDLVCEVSRSCKKLAKELKVPVILLSQLSRQCESRPDKRPQISDLRDSGGIEQDADKVLLIYRPEMYGMETVVVKNGVRRTEKITGEGELIISKNRNGSIGSCRFSYSPDLNKIGDSNGEIINRTNNHGKRSDTDMSELSVPF